MSFTVTLSVEHRTARLALTGELDAATAPAFYDRIGEAADTDPRRLVVDLRQLTYLSSAGLRCLVFARQKLGDEVEMVLEGPRQAVAETIRLTGFDRSVALVDGDGPGSC
jgi:anti-anti-sigma factor